MKNNITFIKSIYMLGIILDGIWGVILAFPSLYKTITNNTDFAVSNEVRVVLLIAASLMFGWTVLLYFGYRKPIERRFILLITGVPVLLGIFGATMFSFLNSHWTAIIFVIKALILLILFISAFLMAERVQNSSTTRSAV